MSDSYEGAEWWSFWGGPACGEVQERVAAAFAPADLNAAPAEHLRILPHFDEVRGSTVVQVHRYVAAPWPPTDDAPPSFWRYAGLTVDDTAPGLA